MYLTYSEYEKYGGMLNEADFGRFAFRAEREIDNATFDRCKSLSQIPKELKQCTYDLIEYISKSTHNGAVLNVSSVSNDGYSLSFTEPKSAAKQIYDIIYAYLSNTGYMYCGVD